MQYYKKIAILAGDDERMINYEWCYTNLTTCKQWKQQSLLLIYLQNLNSQKF